MDKKIQRFYQLKQKQKELEQELAELRSEIISYCVAQEVSELEQGSYRAKLVTQVRKEYDDNKLYEALPDPSIWRLLSKADASKITSLMKLNIISEGTIRGTYTDKQITLLQVDKK